MKNIDRRFELTRMELPSGHRNTLTPYLASERAPTYAREVVVTHRPVATRNGLVMEPLPKPVMRRRVVGQ